MEIQKNGKRGGRVLLFKSLAILVSSAFLAALSIVFGKYLAFPQGNDAILRFSFENLPIIMAGMVFGPAVGVAVGVAADLIGCLLVGYSINPLIMLGAAAIGLVSGLSYYVCGKINGCPYALKIMLSVFLAHTVGSVLIKSFALARFPTSVYYGMPIPVLLLWRLLNYAIIGTLEGFLLWYLLKNKLLTAQINSILRKK